MWTAIDETSLAYFSILLANLIQQLQYFCQRLGTRCCTFGKNGFCNWCTLSDHLFFETVKHAFHFKRQIIWFAHDIPSRINLEDGRKRYFISVSSDAPWLVHCYWHIMRKGQRHMHKYKWVGENRERERCKASKGMGVYDSQSLFFNFFDFLNRGHLFSRIGCQPRK